MEANPALGVMLHAIGGLASASFYIPYKRVRRWSWETYCGRACFFAWIVAPWVLMLLLAPKGLEVLAQTPPKTLFWTYFFGVLWGIGGLTFGLTMRYLGIALGYAVALGLCALFGTLVPPIFKGEFGQIATSLGGQIELAGVLVCLVGIAGSGLAGISKERELSPEKKKESVREFNLVKGLLVAVFAGVMSASMSYGFSAGEDIAKLAVANNTPDLWKNQPVWVVIMAGGFTTNFIWCVILNIRNKSWGQYVGRGCLPASAGEPAGTLASVVVNYALCALAGTMWYLQFFFYGMGATKMGKYGFSSWSLHMGSIIIFSTFWGLGLKEWHGTSRRTKKLVAVGLALLVLSMAVIGYGTDRRTVDAEAAKAAQTQTAKEIQ